MVKRKDRRWELFKCKRCGKCCIEIGLPYDPARIFEIANFLELSVTQTINKYYGSLLPDDKEWVSDDNKRTPCPFIAIEDKKKKCSIYEVRPLGCRLYPFDTDFGRAGVDCPGAKIVFEKLLTEES